jgi:hypothetical protein
MPMCDKKQEAALDPYETLPPFCRCSHEQKPACSLRLRIMDTNKWIILMNVDAMSEFLL